ncbi:MAG: pyruvate formate lyase family protein, partial [Oscillospiraceae bacterium]
MNFNLSKWSDSINVRDFIIKNYTPYDGDESFLAQPTERTKKLWDNVCVLMKEEHKRGGVYDIDEKTISTVAAHDAGFIDKDLETIVGLQTDEPLKRAIIPFGGYRMVLSSLKAYNKESDPAVNN